jgi:mannose-6-phosphate isomerase
MYKGLMFLKPVFQERIWGGQNLKREFGYELPYEKTGECWGISAHPNGPCEIVNGPLKGRTLAFAWENHRELFGDEEGEEFPLLVKILDANNDLSVQVHPDDVYAREIEDQPYGKTECWYVIACKEDAEIIYGHHAISKHDFEQKVENGQWDKLLRSVKVKPGDFIYVPSGTIHAIGKGIMILETQQSSDITYRVYDYDRHDAEGNTRELHLKKAIDVTTIPHKDPFIQPEQTTEDGLTSKKLIQEEYFTVFYWELNGNVKKEMRVNFLLVSVLDGSGAITVEGECFSFKKGDHFIIPSAIGSYELEGNASFIVSHT